MGRSCFLLPSPTKESFWFFWYFCEQNQPIFHFVGLNHAFAGFCFLHQKLLSLATQVKANKWGFTSWFIYSIYRPQTVFREFYIRFGKIAAINSMKLQAQHGLASLVKIVPDGAKRSGNLGWNMISKDMFSISLSPVWQGWWNFTNLTHVEGSKNANVQQFWVVWVIFG